MLSDVFLSQTELKRYNRQLILPMFGLEGQQKLKAARVLVVGSGGLGSPLLLYLTAAGVGLIGIADFDHIDESNLQRQVLFNTTSVGQPKVHAAQKRLKKLNPHVQFELHNTVVNAQNATEIIDRYDLVADGTDNFPTRYLLNDTCILLGKPLVYASIFQFEGQVSVFNFTNSQGETGPNYRDLFPSPPPPNHVPNCAEGGVLGALPGIIGSIQANEIIKIITGIGTPLSGKLFVFNSLSTQTQTFEISKNNNNPLNSSNTATIQTHEYGSICQTHTTRHPLNEMDV